MDTLAAIAGQLQEVIVWHEVANGDLPDADMTVLVRMRDVDAEPVWLGYWTGEVWREASGLEVDVVRWADMPVGGEV